MRELRAIVVLALGLRVGIAGVEVGGAVKAPLLGMVFEDTGQAPHEGTGGEPHR